MPSFGLPFRLEVNLCRPQAGSEITSEQSF
jgi:hypothetical protein